MRYARVQRSCRHPCRHVALSASTAAPPPTVADNVKQDSEISRTLFEELTAFEGVICQADVEETEAGLGLVHTTTKGAVGLFGPVDETLVLSVPANLCISCDHSKCWPWVGCANLAQACGCRRLSSQHCGSPCRFEKALSATCNAERTHKETCTRAGHSSSSMVALSCIQQVRSDLMQVNGKCC